jgi:ribosomal-protein-alanine N-acetyltransferase
MTIMKMPERMETERLILRTPQFEDAHAMFERWAQDSEVTRYLTWRPHVRFEESQAAIARAISAWESGSRFPYMIALQETNDVIGMIDPRIEGPKVGIGYVIGRAYWGNGYMPEATRAMIEWFFQQPTIYCIYATTDVENVASQRVLRKAGMQCEGILRKYIIHPNISEIPRDSYMFAVVK